MGDFKKEKEEEKRGEDMRNDKKYGIWMMMALKMTSNRKHTASVYTETFQQEKEKKMFSILSICLSICQA